MIFGTGSPKFVYKRSSTAVTFTVDTSNDYIISTDHDLIAGDVITVSTTVTLPGGLTASTNYYVLTVVDSSHFTIAASKGGTKIDITSSGSGTHTYDASVTVSLDKMVIVKDEPVVRQIIQESEITGHREYVRRGDHWDFQIRLNLFKYSDPRSKYEELYQYLHRKVSLYRHSDGSPFVDSDGNDALFIFDAMLSKYLTTIDYEDLLILTFKSLDWVDLSDDSIVTTALTEISIGAF